MRYVSGGSCSYVRKLTSSPSLCVGLRAVSVGSKAPPSGSLLLRGLAAGLGAGAPASYVRCVLLLSAPVFKHPVQGSQPAPSRRGLKAIKENRIHESITDAETNIKCNTAETKKRVYMPVGILDNPYRACLRRAAVGLGFALRPTHVVCSPHGRCWTLRGQCCPLYPLLSPLAATAATVPRSSAGLPRLFVQPGTNHYRHYINKPRHNN